MSTTTRYGRVTERYIDTDGILLYQGCEVGVFLAETLERANLELPSLAAEAHVVLGLDTKVNRRDEHVLATVMLNGHSAAEVIGRILDAVAVALGPDAVHHTIELATSYIGGRAEEADPT